MNTKQVIVVRKDLNMRKGKIASQASHASLGAVFSESYVQKNEIGLNVKIIPMQPILEEWFNDSFTKICVSCDSEQELLDLHKQAEEASLLNCLIQDKGHTEFHGVPTYTALAIGPAEVDAVNKITSHLKLL